MLYTELGHTGIETSTLGFGSMRLPMVTIGEQEFVDIDAAVEVIHRAFELGVTYIDTGFRYCNQESEIAVGRALKGWRDKVTLTTKATKMNMTGPGDLRRMLTHQLRKLDVDCLDFYLFHGIGYDNLHEIDQKTGWLSDMQKARQEGLVKHVGFSFHDEPENMKKLVDMGLFDLVTCQYNYLDTKNAEGMAYAHQRGLAVVVMGPVGGGRLAGSPAFLERSDGLDTSRAAQLAVRYVADNPDVSVVLSGMGSVQMVEENVAAIQKGQLDDLERDALTGLLEETKKLSDLYCTGCQYCLPCPQNVEIPSRFEAMNWHRVYGLTDHAKGQYAGIRKKEMTTAGGGECVECGQCEDQCPQNIPVIQQLKETADAIGP